MKPIRDIYPDMGENFYGPCDYTPLLKSLGDIIARVDQDDYQGDSWVLFRDGDRFGYLQFGWGSCSGCDSLQSCDSYAEIEKLREDLLSKIRWGTRAETIAYLHTIDPEVSWAPAELSSFITLAISTMEEP